MKLRFSIEYRAAWGETLCVDIQYLTAPPHGPHRMPTSHAPRHNSSLFTLHSSLLALSTADGITWRGETEVMPPRQKPIRAMIYAYQVMDGGGGVVRREYDAVPRLLPLDAAHNYTLNDGWRERPMMSYLFTKACQTANSSLFTPNSSLFTPNSSPLFRETALFRISAPQIGPGKGVAILGSHPSLGSWDPRRYAPMQYEGDSIWTLSLNVEAITEGLEYKYVVIDQETGLLSQWEGGQNRSLLPGPRRAQEVWLLDGGYLRVKEREWRGAGVAVPLSCLRSSHSFGVGDFGDLKLLADWAEATGMTILQLLPLNDTTKQHSWTDAHPYNAISAHALHPQYACLEAAGELLDADLKTAFRRRRQELEQLPHADYVAVERVKGEYMRLLFSQNRETIAQDKAFKAFVKGNEEWLLPYAAFCLLRDMFQTARWTDWADYAHYDRLKVMKLLKDHFEEAALICYVQYVLHCQLLDAALYARQKGISLMGDLPVGLSPDSVEAWTEGALFHLDSQTGSSPDALNPKGQNWSFPTYDWDAMARSHHRWWRERLRGMEQYFGAFRLDHVIGFFRVWSLPGHAVDGRLGHFEPSMPFSREEIEAAGLTFHEELLCQPYINDKVLGRLFGVHAQYVRDSFLYQKGYQLYGLREEFATQKKIRDHFGEPRDENGRWIRDGLMRLAASLLFIEDERRPGHYHPRARAFDEPIFEAMSPEDRAAFMSLYNNYFYDRHTRLWSQTGLRRLEALLGQTRMLATAEDLGGLPPMVGPALRELRLLSLEVQTMPKERDHEFSHLEANPYLSVDTISTHDMAPLRLWWEEERPRAQRFYEQILQREGPAPEHLPATLAGEIVARHVYCPSMLVILSLQDWLSIDDASRGPNPRMERINTPGDNQQRWQYRMHLPLEQLLRQERLSSKIKAMIKGSKRHGS